ncbi:MAG: glutaminyl-peptide cyclotransferase [Candidatus Hydrogenedentes bacterium]|nr:glutaminyl-peptide cyclotransferase [Candidatus Hydrogenedentota bacterium]
MLWHGLHQYTVLATVAIGALAPLSCIEMSGDPSDDAEQGITIYTYRVVKAFPHDPEAFTQGLVFENGFLYEGTGRRGESCLREIVIETGEVVRMAPLEDAYFGEGIAIVGERIIQLTWRSQIGFVYDKNSFERIGQFTYPTEGWGLTYDGARLIMSDGSSFLYFLDPESFERTGQVQVTGPDGPITRLNELEYIDGEVYANIWRTDRIARIDPLTGDLLAWINLEGLLASEDRTGDEDVLNGIAYDADTERLFVTGKLWPKVYEIELLEARE